MRRAERLFRLIQILRRGDGPVTADAIAGELEVSRRTIYRDIAHLVGSGVPVTGEAGVGYVLDEGFDLPPLTLSYEQIDALLLGMQSVTMMADSDLAKAGAEALAKIEQVLPENHSKRLRSPSIFAIRWDDRPEPPPLLPFLRKVIRTQHKIQMTYERQDGQRSDRTIRPLALLTFGLHWLLIAWCESRGDFRNFRADRITAATCLDETFTDESGRTLQDFLDRQVHA